MKRIYLLLLVFVCSAQLLVGQEICDNGIDDDNDGLIDLNDDDCVCDNLVASSLIPNPSFEDMLCCPDNNEQLNCAVDWIQASAPTTDYVHTCGGFLGNNSIGAVAPLPFPDGEGAVGLRDGQFFAGSNYKEYVGACLTETMEIGVTYRLDFFIGFRDNIPGSGSFNIAFFGSTDCSNLPFGGNSTNIGCPVNAGGYTQLSTAFVSGSNEWINVVIEFVADQPYEVLVVGPSCEGNTQFTQDPYFYIDRLALAESSEFGIPYSSVDGAICENNLQLSVEDISTSTYQWYLNGIALIGETSSTILLTAVDNLEGSYSVAITSDETCQISRTYDLRIPPYYTDLDETICSNESFPIAGQELTLADDYEILLVATDGCDSIIRLSLNVEEVSTGNLSDSFCDGDTYSLYDLETTMPGMYELTVPNDAGCDSIITLDLSMVPLPADIILAALVEVNLGETVDIIPDFTDVVLTTFVWSDPAGLVIAESRDLIDFQPTVAGLYILTATDDSGCGVSAAIEIIIDTNYEIYVPNIFSPNGDIVNDEMNIFFPSSVESLLSFHILDRWGNIVFDGTGVPNVNWDGTFQGRGTTAETGVYVYVTEVLFIDGHRQHFMGDITLLK